MEFFLQFIATFAAALFAGGALYISVAEHPGRMQAGIAVAVAEFPPSYRRAAPWQASLAGICLLCGMLVSFLSSDWGWALGSGCVGLVIPFTLVAIMPTNRRLLAKPPPSDAEAHVLLQRWARLHWVRSILGTAGLVVLLLQVFAD